MSTTQGTQNNTVCLQHRKEYCDYRVPLTHRTQSYNVINTCLPLEDHRMSTTRGTSACLQDNNNNKYTEKEEEEEEENHRMHNSLSAKQGTQCDHRVSTTRGTQCDHRVSTTKRKQCDHRVSTTRWTQCDHGVSTTRGKHKEHSVLLTVSVQHKEHNLTAACRGNGHTQRRPYLQIKQRV